METQPLRKERHDNLDLLKSLAIYFVIVYHFNHINNDFIKEANFSPYLNYYFTSILSTCVPIFFFVNGALLLNKEKLDLNRHIYKIIKLVCLTIIWAFLILFILMYIRNEKLSLHDFVLGIWMLKPGWNDHLWFLQAMVVIYLFYPLIYLAWKTNRRYLYFFFVAVLILTFGNILISNFAVVTSFFSKSYMAKDLSRDYFTGFNAFTGIYGYSIGYFILGGLVFYNRAYLNTGKFKYFSIPTIAGSMFLLSGYGIIASKRQKELWDLVWYGYDTIFTLINVVSLFILTMNYRESGLWGKFIKTTGENSLGIYLLHILVGSFFFPYFLQFPFNNLTITNAVFAFLILIISLFVVLLLKRIPVLRNLFSI